LEYELRIGCHALAMKRFWVPQIPFWCSLKMALAFESTCTICLPTVDGLASPSRSRSVSHQDSKAPPGVT
jgi:hypothetical protein